MNREVIWSKIKTIRNDYLVRNSDLTCENSFIPMQNVINNYEKLSQFIGVKGSEEAYRNLSKSDVNIGAEMFLALNSCPSFYVRLYWNAIYGPKSRTRLAVDRVKP